MRFSLVCVLALLCVCSSSAFAISEQNFDQVYDSQVVPFYEHPTQAGTFTGQRGVEIVYRTYEHPDEKGALVLSPGKGESLIKYAEVMFDLYQQGYSIYIVDHRGQGFSGREVKNPEIIYVRKFGDYVDDFKTFVDQVVNAKPHAKRYLVAHSMGGAIGALYLERYPFDFDAAVLSSPMLEINTGKYSEGEARVLADLFCLFGQGKSYALGQGDYNVNETFEQSDTIHSPIRYKRDKLILLSNPEIITGGASFRWVAESLKATSEAVEHAGDVLIPVLLQQSGDDKLVRPGGQDRFCEAAGDCAKIAYPGAYHELFMERDAIRDPAMEDLVSFLGSH